MTLFSEFGLLDSLLSTLKEKKIYKPTEIQKLAIPLMMSGQSVVGVSETGSGKTLTYALPLLNALKNLELEKNPVTEEAKPRAVIMVPTRELGEQVAKVFKTFTHLTRLRVRPALGGMTFEQARRNVSGPFEILLATPGRLIQLLKGDLISLDQVQTLIFDEADQMLDQGFLPDAEEIVAACPEGIQMALFSATVSITVQELINKLFVDAEVIRSQGSGQVVKTLKTHNRTVVDGKRWPIFQTLLEKPIDGGTIIFTNTREQCDKLALEIKDKGFQCVVYRGEMDKNERNTNLKKFRKGEIKFLVSTDLAARGLDIENVDRVINFHLPQQMENYIHRVGRTARAGKEGSVINLVTERDERLIAKLEGRKISDKKSYKSKEAVKSKDNLKSKENIKSKDSVKSKDFVKTKSRTYEQNKVQTKVKSKAQTKTQTKTKTYSQPKAKSEFKKSDLFEKPVRVKKKSHYDKR